MILPKNSFKSTSAVNSARRHGLGSDSVLFTTTLISLFSCVLDEEDAETAVRNKKDQRFIFSKKRLIFILNWNCCNCDNRVIT